MITFDKKSLPTRLTEDNISTVAGERVRWFCPTCRKWRVTVVKQGGGVTCSKCGATPDWKRRWPVLSFHDRLKRVNALCAEGSSWREEHDRVVREYCNFIDDIWAGRLPQSTQRWGWKYYGNCWEAVDAIADYLLGAPDAPATNAPHTYTERGLQRRYYDSRRSHNVISLSGLNLPYMADNGNVRLTDQEVAEVLSFRKGYSTPFYDKYFENEIFEAIEDPLERAIAVDFAQGATKRDIERKYGLTERRVRTIVSHIAKSLKNMLKNC